jgi:uncharacterized protein
MKKLFLVAFLFLLAVCPVWAQNFPAPVGYVNDFANILSSETKQNLEQRLTQLEKDSTIEISVVTVESLGGTTVEDYAARLFENWQIGKKDKDNGVLFLIAPNERETKIEVGYGLEPVLTDAQAGRILDSYVVPAFRDGDYNKGVNDGVSALIKIVHGEEVNLEPATSAEAEDGNGVWILLVIVAIFLSYLTSFLARSKKWWPGGVIGAILGLVLGFYLASLTFKVLAVVGLGLLGLLFDFILSKNYKERKGRGLPTSFWGSGGGFFGGGGSGGGFGGFGGGGSGGGGASRSW